jgi:hypothetical protein
VYQRLLWAPPVLNRNSLQAKDLALWWPGGEFGDALGRNRPTTFGSGAKVVADELLGKVWSLDGTANGFVTRTNIELNGIAFNNVKGHSFTAWVKPSTSLSTLQYAVNITSGSLTLNCFAITTAGALVCGQDIAFGGATLGTFVASAVANTWYLLGYSWVSIGGVNTHTMFLNGRQIATSTAAQHTGVIAQMDIGRRNDVGGVGNPFTGRVADARFYTRALSEAEHYHQWNPNTRWDLYVPYDIYAFKSPAGVVTPLSAGGSLTAAGALVRKVNKPVAGSQAPIGLVVRQPIKVYAGTATSVGAPRLQTNKRVSGSLTSSGLLASVKVATLSVAGSLPLSGILARKTNKLLTGAITSAGILVRFVSRAFAGTLGSSGALSKQTNKRITGTLTLSGALTQRVNKLLAGILTDVGALIRFTSRTLAGALGSSGALSRQPNKRSVGTLTFAGGFAQRVNKPLTGTLTFAGNISSKVSRIFTGTLTSAGSAAVLKITGSLQTLSVAGTLTLSGILTPVKKKFVTITGTLTLAGVLRCVTQKNITGAVTPVGALHFFLPRKFTGVLGLAGIAFKQVNKALKRGIHYDAPLPYDAHIHYDSHEAPMLFLKGELTRDKSGIVGIFPVGTMGSSGRLNKLVNKALAGTVILGGPVTLVTHRFITKLSRTVTKIQLDSRFTGLRHVASKIGVAVTANAKVNRIVTSVAKKISIAPRVER